jgi:hypothetical protein
MSTISHDSFLFSPECGPKRAWEFGEASMSSAVTVQTLFLPRLSFGPDLWVETSEGWVQGRDLTNRHWLRVTKPEMSDSPVPFDLPTELHFDGPYGYFIYSILRQAQPVVVVDMMTCPDHVAHWRSDRLLLQTQELERWYSGMVGQGQDSWWMRVLKASHGFARVVPLSGRWEAFGVPVAA